MNYYSLNGKSPKVSFKDATIQGQAPDKGLYFPENIPSLQKDFIENIAAFSKEEIALSVISPYVGDTIPANELTRIVSETLSFDFPLVKINDDIYSLELFHGPTLAFKDVGARFMSRCMRYFTRNHDKEVTVLVATSGDTGGAVANGFYGVDGVNVVILYPSGKVSTVQELQLTTLGNNISAIEINGTFDDCQQLVKQAFTDEALNKKLFLTSANSINIARWLPQQFYYFFAYQQWPDKKNLPIISVPSGNFGNICAGLLAHHSGLPFEHFIAACNSNDIVPSYLENGSYQPKKAIATLSNAMDVGNPSNFVRILELFHKEFNSLKETLTSYSISDKETLDTIATVYANNNYLLDPHGAVGYLALKKYLEKHIGQKGIVLETAHPVKFYDVVEPVIHTTVPIPPAIQAILEKKKQRIRMDVNYADLKEHLLLPRK
ncbi:MAG: threonine synthase [Bacteroidetes bacterium]|nr:threonine synthase [Bacteroidota bacterium]